MFKDLSFEEYVTAKNAAFNVEVQSCTFSYYFDALVNLDKFSTTYQNHAVKDFELLRSYVKENNVKLSEAYSVEGFHRKYQDLVTSYNDVFDINISPKLFIVDEFPVPFKDKEWDSFSLDANDQKRLGLPSGFYFKREKLSSPNFELIISHEIVHIVISEFSTDYHAYVTLYEEGVCDFVGLYFLFKNGMVSNRALTNFIIYARSSKEDTILWHSYWKALNLITSKAVREGINSIIDLIKMGRSQINNIGQILNTSSQEPSFANQNEFYSLISEANSILALRISEYDCLNRLIMAGTGFFLNREVADMFQDSNYDYAKSVAMLVDKGILYREEEKLYNPYKIMPKFVKYAYDESN